MSKNLKFYGIQALKLAVSIVLAIITLGIFPLYGDEGGGGPNTVQEDRF